MAGPEHVDVLICGSGSAGLCAAVWLSRLGVSYKIIERRDGPLQIGQADGVQTRTVEIFDSFGLAEDLLKESYHVLELAFWSPLPGAEGEARNKIRRSHFAPDKETEISHQPHVILNQARLNALMIGDIERSGGEAGVRIDYGCDVKGLTVDETLADDENAYCVTVDATQNGKERQYRAKYVLGCDGAHSTIRRSLGFKMVGDSSDAVWGVMDVFPRTSFPDIRKKAVINAAAGNLLIIPREGDAMVRFYIELPSGTQVRDVTLQSLQDRARLIFAPYTMETAETAWWSAYAIGQRRADCFHKNLRVFLTGDACHTHSPKAGQGMNVSLQDGYNIGWKLGMILNGHATAKTLLETYVVERERTARELIEFDLHFTRLFNSKYREANGISPQQFAEQFVKAGRYTAGQAIRYDESAVVAPGKRDEELAAKATVGMRFPSAQVVRFSDAKAMQLVKALPADGRWYLVVFGGDILDKEGAERLDKVSEALNRASQTFTAADSDPDSIIDRILVLSSDRIKVEQEQIPGFFVPVTGKYKMKSPAKVYVDDESYNSGHGHAYEEYGVSAQKGALVIVRPDHYVAKVAALDDDLEKSVTDFFKEFLLAKN
ncbi:FAD binding domain-containing protein [Bombardia bombarda]|uniref:FAD binding domain-containing protein n=1 Tax=Bombardia bombarda TaxID=252184 RepID=A0AA39WCB0_9PEZI|nr:FAD binding domain-containing protein [Bombardia bombarda]